MHALDYGVGSTPRLGWFINVEHSLPELQLLLRFSMLQFAFQQGGAF
jgi:hypothetical protein